MQFSKSLTLFCGLLAVIGTNVMLPTSPTESQPKAAVAYPTVNVKMDCGAKGDGRSDDTWFNAGHGRAFFTDSTYLARPQEKITPR